MEGAEGFVRFFEFLADRDILGAVLLALSAADALGGKGGFLCQADGLRKLEAALAFGFREHCVVAAEDSRNVDSFGTGHTVAAACAADLFLLADYFFDLFQNFEVRLCQMAGLCLRGCSAVFLYHLQGIHAGKDDCHFRLVVEPAESPLGGAPAAAALLHDFFGVSGKHVDQFPTPKRFHDHYRDSLCSSSLETVHTCLRNLVQVIVLNLTEIPVIIIQYFLEIVGVSMVRETDVPDGARLFFLFDPFRDSDLLQFFPHGKIGQMVHQIVVNIGGAQTGQLLVKIFVQVSSAFDHVLGQLGRDIDFLTDLIALENFSQRRFTARIDVSSVIVVDAGTEGSQNLRLCLLQIDAVPLSGETHASESQHRKFISTAVFSVNHVFLPGTPAPEFLFYTVSSPD